MSTSFEQTKSQRSSCFEAVDVPSYPVVEVVPFISISMSINR